MANNTLDNSRISKHLGQTSQYKSQYDPDLDGGKLVFRHTKNIILILFLSSMMNWIIGETLYLVEFHI